MAKISVIIPAYNAENCLERSAKSVLSQTSADLELIIVNDGSTDSTAQVCEALGRRDGRVRVIDQPNSGVSAARNRGLDEAAGEYIAFVDADDSLQPGAYSRLRRAMEETGADCAAAGHYMLWPDGTREEVPPPFPAGRVEYPEIVEKLVVPLLADRVCASPVPGTIWRYLFRRDRIRDMGIRFSGAYLEDELFLIEYFARETSLACVTEPIYDYFQNPASVTHRYLPDFCATFEGSLAKKRQLVEKYGIAVPDFWEDNTAWAGLLIAVSNEFAPGNPAGLLKKRANVKKICALPVFAHAIANYEPVGMNRNKGVVASLLRRRAFLPLALLYTYKNRNRK